MKPTYENFRSILTNLLGDLSILAGDCVGPSNSSWQDVAGTAATNAEVLARLLHKARAGEHQLFLAFPSPSEILNNNDETHGR